MNRRGFFCLLFLGLAAGPASAQDGLTDDQLLRAAGLSPDGPALVQFFQARALPRTEPDHLTKLITALGAKEPAARDRALGQLVALGPLAMPALREAARDPDPSDVSNNAKRALKLLADGQGESLPVAAARVLARLRPPGAAEALLAYLPFADDETVLDEIKAVLIGLAVVDNKPEPAFVKALSDPSALKRATAAEVLCRAGGESVAPTVRKLLADPRPVVRLRVGLALAEMRDPEAVRALIDLLANLPPTLARSAEDFLVNLAGDEGPKAAVGTTPETAKAAADAWRAWWQANDGVTALAQFKKRTLTDADREKVTTLVRQLGDDSFDVRERATLSLQGMGSAIAPLLRQAAASDDEEVKKRAQKCLEVIDKDRTSTFLPVQARVIALRKPAGAAQTLLGFVPFADDEPTLDEVRAALAAVAVRDGKADPTLVAALEDRLAVRRGVAAEALVLGGAIDARPAARKLLQDADPTVRLRTALALAQVRERDAVPILIDLMGELPSEKGATAEVYLRGVVGDRAPNLYLGPDDATRKKVRDVWAAWWKDNGATVDLGRVSGAERQLGYTLLVSTDFNRIMEVGLDGKTRWQLDNLQYPRDAQVLPGDRILIAEQGIQRVSEWNMKREVLWQKQTSGPPVGVQRLRNGNTTIIMSNGIIEVDRAGKEVFTYSRPSFDIMAGQRAADGQMVLITNNGMVVRVDSKGKETKTFNLGGQSPWSVELLPNGRVLVPLPNLNKVAEYDADGKIVWEAAVQNPFSAQRLSNGNTIVASYNQMKVVELNRAGRVVWEHKTGNQDRPYRARRR